MNQETKDINQNSFGDSNSETTVIQFADSNAKSTGSTLEKGEDECVIDISNDEFVGENQRVCRICHLSAKESGKSFMELMELGCGCKGELGFAHLHCAEAWFRIKGNRLCEICGENAKNITGMRDNGFMEEWNERRSGADTGTNLSSSDESRRCLRGQPLCNFLMACLVVAFVLPWFLRVNMF
ncbi:hypothetical protein ACJIZ3_006167 [Penstemon smallii]|uniref:RING-CH-type domain-containing protein n=1 Tax=Penstemon smallii TaxID=265156 RepID=A0ABD3S711_9LAMI